MTLSIGSVFEPLNEFFLARFGTPDGSPVVFRFDRFGSVVSQDDFRTNPADPTSPYSPAVAREKISDLVNRVPSEVGDGAHVVLTADPIDSVYSEVLLKPSQPYLPAGTTATARGDLVQTFSSAKAGALKQWDNSELTSVLGSPLAVHATDCTPGRWWDPADNAVWTRHELTVHDTAQTSQSEPVVWRMIPTDVQLVRVMKTVHFPQLNRPTALVSAGAPSLEMIRPDIQVLPEMVDRRSFLELRQNKMVLDARARLELAEQLDLVAPKDPVTTDTVSISFEYCLVTLTRSWWSRLITSPTWRTAGNEQGSLNAPGVPGGLRQLPVGFVAVRNVSIDASWSDADRARVAGAMSFGPFDVSASAGSSSVAQPGLQIFGWLLQQLPALPPNPPTDGPASTDEEPPASEPGSTRRKHRVRRGDTLSGIAAKYYGDASKFKRIQKANKIKNPADIAVGQVLIIP